MLRCTTGGTISKPQYFNFLYLFPPHSRSITRGNNYFIYYMSIKTATHQVFNQFSEIRDYNLYTSDKVLVEYFKENKLDEYNHDLEKWGKELGSADSFHAGHLANEYPPVLKTHDNRGNRIDYVEFHPAWHRFKQYCKHSGLIARPYYNEGEFRWTYAAAYFILHTQVEAGSLCPATMTLSCIPLLKKEPTLWAIIGNKLLTREYDKRDVPISEKSSIWIGMGLTEKQGGTDVKQNTTTATPVDESGRGREYRITGHKWFFSAPMSDAHLVVARTSDTDEICCFYVPRWKPDGNKNPLHIQRLKDKLGNKSNASSEIEFRDAYGILIGKEGKGIRTIMEMANITRFCCVLGSTGILRQAMIQAIAYTRKRKVFGKVLSEQPLMRNVLVDLALESEAAAVLSLRLAEAYENADNDSSELAWKRFITPAAKYWVCKRAEAVTAEAMEIFGGNGYIEDGVMARLYREAPVNSIWEGSGNVMCLDVLRVMKKSPEFVESVLEDLKEMSAGESRLEQAVRGLEEKMNLHLSESQGRVLAEKLIILTQACLLRERSPSFISETFIQLRIQEAVRTHFGAFEATEIPYQDILERGFLIK